MIGSGPGTIVKLANSTNKNINIINILGSSAAYIPNISISNFTIDGNRANQASGVDNAINFDYAASTTIENMWIKEMKGGGGVTEDQSTGGHDIHVLNSHVANVDGSGIAGSFGSDNQSFVIANNTVDGAGSYGISIDGGGLFQIASQATSSTIPEQPLVSA